MSLVAITKDCKGIADGLYDLGIEIISASSFTYRAGSTNSTISIDINLKKDSLIGLLGDFPAGWEIYTEMVSADRLRLPIVILGYSETVENTMVDARIVQVTGEFERFLQGFDPQAIKSVATLKYS
ncbi:hypothetical protein [Desulfitobacterium hafniense]|nr:hypothetical protein [Desulfitobacterium hafniense]